MVGVDLDLVNVEVELSMGVSGGICLGGQAIFFPIFVKLRINSIA